MHAKEKGVKLSLPAKKAYVDCGQLDVSLAMRDQRMLIEALHSPRKIRQTLRNNLTPKYPAVPFPRTSSLDSEVVASDNTSKTVSDDETDTPWDLNRSQPGLEESLRSRLIRITREVSDSVVAALESSSDQHCHVSRSMSRSLTPELVLGSVPDPCYNKKRPSWSEIRAAEEKKILESKSEGVLNSDSYSRRSMERSVRSSVSSDRVSDRSSRSRSVLHDIGGTQLHKLTGNSALLKEESNNSSIELHKILGVNINIECINKYMSKPISMYSFICAQNFRRDEYPWHFKVMEYFFCSYC